MDKMAKQMLCFKYVLYVIIVTFIFQDINAQSSLDCTFSNGFCKWKQDESNVTEWNRRMYPVIDSGDWYYIYVSGSYTNNRQKAKLISPIQEPGQNCLIFTYGLSHYDVLNVLMLYRDGSKHVISNMSDIYAWKEKAVISINASSKYKVVIEGTTSNKTSNNTLWLDDIFMGQGFCTDCNFDSGLCYWSDVYSNDIHWTLQKSEDGPTNDHTTGGGQNVHTGSSRSSNAGNAMLIGPEQSAGKYCFSFWYYMSRKQVDVLRVLAVTEQPMPREIRTITGSYGQRWIHHMDIFQSNESFQIAFGGRFTSGKGEIAIDDVVLLSCQNCGDPSPNYGHANATTFQYGSVVEIICDTGYNLTGSQFILCQANGLWSNIATCDPFEKKKEISTLIPIYVMVPIIAVASAICFTIVFLRKKHPKCLNSISSTDKSQATSNVTCSNNTYNGETSQRKNYANRSYADEQTQSTVEYAFISDCSNDTNRYSNNATYKTDEKHKYDQTKNVPKISEDTSYSHISVNRSNHTDESSYDTTVDLNSGCLARLEDSTNADNCYNVINMSDHIKTPTSQARKVIEEPDYDHAKAGGSDPSSVHFDDYSHLNGGVSIAKRYKDTLELYEYPCVGYRAVKKEVYN